MLKKQSRKTPEKAENIKTKTLTSEKSNKRQNLWHNIERMCWIAFGKNCLEKLAARPASRCCVCFHFLFACLINEEFKLKFPLSFSGLNCPVRLSWAAACRIMQMRRWSHSKWKMRNKWGTKRKKKGNFWQKKSEIHTHHERSKFRRVFPSFYPLPADGDFSSRWWHINIHKLAWINTFDGLQLKLFFEDYWYSLAFLAAASSYMSAHVSSSMMAAYNGKDLVATF